PERPASVARFSTSTRARSGVSPDCPSSDVARSRRSDGNADTVRLTPYPSTITSPTASARMPASLRPDAQTAFGHFTSPPTPVLAWIPSAMATPAASVSNVVARRGSTHARAGARTVETYNPLPGGENHVRPRRPPPDVWGRA